MSPLLLTENYPVENNYEEFVRTYPTFVERLYENALSDLLFLRHDKFRCNSEIKVKSTMTKERNYSVICTACSNFIQGIINC